MRLPGNGEHKVSFLYKVSSLQYFVIADGYILHLEQVTTPVDSSCLSSRVVAPLSLLAYFKKHTRQCFLCV